MARILVADDEPSICEAFAALLAAEGHQSLTAANGREAVQLVRSAQPDVVFLDVRMPGLDGISALKEIRAFDSTVPVIVMTAYGTLDTASEALRNDAFDYLGKPLDLAKIRQLLQRALHARTTPTAPSVALDPITGQTGARQLVGQSPAMQEIFKRIVLLADNEMSVLVQGESGTGKELVARAIHAHSPRRERPFEVPAARRGLFGLRVPDDNQALHNRDRFGTASRISCASTGSPTRFAAAAGESHFLRRTCSSGQRRWISSTSRR